MAADALDEISGSFPNEVRFKAIVLIVAMLVSKIVGHYD
jgi:hypothetical protein